MSEAKNSYRFIWVCTHCTAIYERFLLQLTILNCIKNKDILSTYVLVHAWKWKSCRYRLWKHQPFLVVFDVSSRFPAVLLLSSLNGVVMLNFLRRLDVVWKAPDDKSVELTPIRWLIVPHQKYEALFIKRPLLSPTHRSNVVRRVEVLLVITLCLRKPRPWCAMPSPSMDDGRNWYF